VPVRLRAVTTAGTVGAIGPVTAAGCVPVIRLMDARPVDNLGPLVTVWLICRAGAIGSV